MSLAYRLLYLVGFTPWDTGAVPAELVELIEGDSPLPRGRALDLGCGTGTQSVYLAQQGWDVTGVDAIDKPLRRARARAAAAKVSVNWVRGDVARLSSAGLDPGFDLMFDRGCFHGLSAAERAAYATAVSELSAPGGTLLMMAFAPNTVRFGPSGASEDELAALFAGWEISSTAADAGPDPGGPLRDVPRRWYRFTREGR
jgi:cyclopropane fatty-acyl-phospholipid synthase-like methyltransferase